MANERRRSRDTLMPVTYNRRRAIGAGIGVAVVALLGDSRATTALRGWCRSDPLITIDGKLADIFCTAPLTALWKVTGPTEIVVSVPVGVKTVLLLAGPGFGRGEKVRFKASAALQMTPSAIDVEVAVRVPAKDDLPIGVEFAPHIVGILNPARAEGVANEWFTLATKMPTSLDLSSLLRSESRREAPKGRRRRAKRKNR